MARKIQSILNNQQLFVFWTTLAFYFFILFFNPNNKILLLFLALLFIFYYLYFKKFSLALFLFYIISIIFLVGKTYFIEIIPKAFVKSRLYPQGRMSALIITPNDIISFLMLLLILKKLFLKKLKLPKGKNFYLLILYYVWLFISLLVNPTTSVFFIMFLQNISILVFILFKINFIDKKALPLSLALIKAIIVFEGSLVLMQFIKKSPLGSSIELSMIPAFGSGIDENPFFYRPVGTFHHANELANFSLPFVLILFSFLYNKKLKDNSSILLTSILLGVIIIILTASRAVWLSLFLSLLLLVFIIEKKFGYHLNLKKINLKYLILILITIAIISLPVLPWRIGKSFYLFEEKGGAFTRKQLIKESISLIKKYPLFGVGYGQNIQASFKQNLTGIMSYFPEAVHNAFLIVASESGLPALLLFISIFLFESKKLILAIKKEKEYAKIIPVGLLVAKVSLIINMFFNPFNNLGLFIFINYLFLNG